MGIFNSKQTFTKPQPPQPPKRDPLVDEYLKNIAIFTSIACQKSTNNPSNNKYYTQPDTVYQPIIISAMSGMPSDDFVSPMSGMPSGDFVSPMSGMPSGDFVSSIPLNNFTDSIDHYYSPSEYYKNPNPNCCNENYENSKDHLNYDTIARTWTKQNKYQI